MDATASSELHNSPQHLGSCAHERLSMPGLITFPEIDSSSDLCRVCCLYKDILLDFIRGHPPGLLETVSKNETEEKLKLGLGLSYQHGNLRIHMSEQRYSLAIFRDADAEGDMGFTVQGQRFSGGHRVGRYTNSKESFERAQKWLSDCLTSHACPRPSIAGVPLPKRLLDVQGSSSDPIRLIDTQGNEYPYVCLSHRWGDPRHKQLKTTTRTIQEHMDEINWHDLPATFQDAVTVCRSMDIRYLWIDSLCILQHFDDITPDELETTGQDFSQENSTMSRTYQNSHFTISADLSTHMDSGIFSKHPVDEHRIEVTTDDGNRAFLYIRQDVNHYGDKTPSLERRGWTLQEFLLPPRVLHFGVFDIEWRCKTRLTCECGHLDREHPPQASWHRHHFIEEATKHPPDDPEGALRWWEQVVHNYTSRQLTNSSDKLPALSGLAQQRKQVRGGVYLAGLWQDSLFHDLCWYHVLDYNDVTSGGVGRRPAHYRAPSWSWASVNTDSGCSWWWSGAVGLHPIITGEEPKPACIILNSVCEPATSDPTGEVQSGFLDIKVALIPAEVCRDSTQRVVWTIGKVESSLPLQFFKPDCELEDDGLAIEDRVFCAPIAAALCSTGLRYGCLVLKQLDTNTYQRVGFCILGKCEMVSTFSDFYLSGRNLRKKQNSTGFNPEDYALPDSARVQIKIV